MTGMLTQHAPAPGRPGRPQGPTRRSLRCGAEAQAGLEAARAAVTGRSFLCTQCGKCCTGEGEVWVSDAEAHRLAEHLRLDRASFAATHLKPYTKRPGWSLVATKGEAEDCVFLEGKLCSVHSVRPLQCATFPWWPDAMLPDGGWHPVYAELCEGLGHPEATVCDTEAAAQQLLLTKEQYRQQEQAKREQRQRRLAMKAAKR